MMTYQVFYCDTYLCQFSQPEFAQRLVDYARYAFPLCLEILPERDGDRVIDLMLNTIECHTLVYLKTGVKV